MPHKDDYRVLFERASDLLAVLDDRGRLRLTNPSFQRAVEMTPEALHRQTLFDLVVPEDRIRVREAMRALCQSGGSARLETRLRGAGVEVAVEGSITCGAPDRSSDSVFHCIFRDIRDRSRVERMKSDFVSTVSHELRTPLTSLHAALTMLQMGALDGRDDEKRTLLEISVHNTERLIELINDLLDIAKIEAGKLSIEPQLVALDRTIDSAVGELALLAQSRGTEIVFGHRETKPMVHADRSRLLQVLRNLLSNAIKFGGTDAPIEVDISSRDDRYRVEVRDRGPGISAVFRPRLFEKFAQDKDESTLGGVGTGLGLSICRALIEAMGGTIDQHNRDGGGSTFFFELPRREIPSIIRDSRAYPIAPPRFLVIESDPDIAHLIKLYLRDASVAVDIAFSGEQARQLLARGLYDGLTMALRFADEEPGQFIEDLRRSPRGAELPLIIIAERGQIELQRAALEPFGIFDWLDKPIDEPRLRQAVAVALGRSGIGDAKRILVVEGDAELAQLIQIALRDGAEVEIAGSLDDAKSRGYHGPWAALVIDLDIDDAPGDEILAFLAIDHVPIVVISAEEIAADVRDRAAASFVKTRQSMGDLVDAVGQLLSLGADAQPAVESAP
ncbi:MAG: response regulator [Myxococcales bacterium]|nr:response regulator [Myxococcales bacterium]